MTMVNLENGLMSVETKAREAERDAAAQRWSLTENSVYLGVRPRAGPRGECIYKPRPRTSVLSKSRYGRTIPQ
jgi:hypothetical protein